MIKLKNDRLFSIVFLTPALFFYSAFVTVMILMTIYYSFFTYPGIGAKSFTGLNNFVNMVKDKNFLFVAKNTLIFLSIALVMQVGIGLILAYLLSKTTKAFKFFRMTFFLPVIISSAATAVLFVYVFRSTGPLNGLLDLLGLEALQKNWLSDKNTVLYAVIMPEVWQSIGVYFVIMLAGMQTIPRDVIESAEIDGAKGFRTLVSIILPMMSEVIQICIIFATTNIVKSINYGQIMTGGGPGYSSSYISTYTYRKIFTDFEYGYGSAIAVFILVILMIGVIIYKGINNFVKSK